MQAGIKKILIEDIFFVSNCLLFKMYITQYVINIKKRMFNKSQKIILYVYKQR